MRFRPADRPDPPAHASQVPFRCGCGLLPLPLKNARAPRSGCALNGALHAGLPPKRTMWRIAVAGASPEDPPMQQSPQSPPPEPPPVQAQVAGQDTRSARGDSRWRIPPTKNWPPLLVRCIRCIVTWLLLCAAAILAIKLAEFSMSSKYGFIGWLLVWAVLIEVHSPSPV